MMRSRRLVLAAPLGLAGCSLLPAQKYIPRANWPLQPPPPSFRPTPPTGPVLLVRAIAPAPGLEGRGLQTLGADGSLHSDFYNLWAVPPAEAVTQALISWAQASGLFAAVVTPGSRLNPDLIVEGELTQLLADLPARTARAALTLTIIKPSGAVGGYPQPLAQLTLAAQAPLPASDPAAQAAAENQAVANLLTQGLAALARYARP